MELNNYKISKIQIIQITIVIIILLAGIITAVILTQRPHIFKSRATNDVFNGFEVKKANGDTLPVVNNAPGIRTYQTDDLNITINVKDINALIKE